MNGEDGEVLTTAVDGTMTEQGTMTAPVVNAESKGVESWVQTLDFWAAIPTSADLTWAVTPDPRLEKLASNGIQRFKGGHQKEDVLAEQPEAFQVDYELDPPVLFSINPDDNRGLLGVFKSLAEELMDETEQPMNQQPLNQHLVLVSQPAPENPSPRSIGKVKNGCVLDKQIFEEIEMIAPTAGEAILEVTSPEDYRDSNIK
ncbi:UNVERIFIED_CONTAM: hypothetical protein K2H54_014968 [Gekko kuhli]